MIHFTFPPVMHKSYNFSASSYSPRPFFGSHPSRCEEMSDWGFDLHLVTNDVEHLFVCLLAIGISSLEECLFKFFT